MVVKKEEVESSRGHDVEEATERVDILIHSTSLTMEEKYASLKNAIKETTPSPKPLIQRVPYMLQKHKNFFKYYEPKVMAIGPLHCRKPHLQPAEQLKLRLAGLFVEKSGMDTEVLYNKIWTEITAIRECFDQEETKSFTDEQLAWMLFVDGCAVLHLIKCTIKKNLKKLDIKDNQLGLIIWQDLFLLENQIPFRVLELLTSSDSDMKKQWRHDIEIFVAMNIETTEEEIQEIQEIQENQSPIHLLHLLRQMHLSQNPHQSWTWHTSREAFRHTFREAFRLPFRNVKQDLKSAGICLERSKTRLLTDISFNSRRFAGKLKLPPITVDGSTGIKFMNLIAYEMCPDYHNNLIVNSYVCFLHSLVDKAEDVVELRKSLILFNFLGSDEEVVHLFNDISTHLTPNPWTYIQVRKDMEKHCNTYIKWKVWMAQARHDYFRSPWTVTALVGAVLALLLTAIQTWFTIFPSN